MTPALRFHIGGLLLTLFAKAVFILAVGIEAHVLLFCEAVTLLFQLFHHSNITFSGEQLLAKLFIVPAGHRVHHSTRRDEHDHNYGAVFSVWDRLFRTGKEAVPADIGLARVSDQNFGELLWFASKDIEDIDASLPMNRRRPIIPSLNLADGSESAVLRAPRIV